MKEHNYTSMNKFLLDCIQAYLSQGYVFPNKKDTQDLNKYLRSISNSIAQIAQKIHVYCLRNKSQSNQLDTGIENLTKLLKGIELLQEDVEKIKTATNVFTATPQSKVLEFTWDEIKDNQDNRLDTLITFLTTYRNNLPCQSSNQ